MTSLQRRLVDERSLEGALDAINEAGRGLLPGKHLVIRSYEGAKSTDLHARTDEGMPNLANDPDYERMQELARELGTMRRENVVVGDEVVGSVTAVSPAGTSFENDDEVVLRWLADCAATAILRARLERLAITDPRTLAFNERYLEPRLREEIDRAARQATPLSVLLLDLDHFKHVNDRYGHAVGDHVLRSFVELVRRSVRLTDVLVRRGGEEFVLLMPHTDMAHASAVAERIRHGLASKGIVVDDGREVRQTVSIGVATWDGVESPGELERRADQAMYRAKSDGRNLVVASVARAS